MNRRLGGILAFWFSAAIVISFSGALRDIQMPRPQLLIVGLTLAFVAAFAVSERLRSWAFSLDLTRLTVFHMWRVIPGVAFLLMYQHGKLPYGFAVPAGIGDILIAVTAPFAAILALSHRRALLLWHLLGFADLVNVVTLAAVIGMADQKAMDLLRHFPFSMLPLILVPLTMQVHFLAIVQTLRNPFARHATA